MGIRVDIDECTGCGNCIDVCPFGLIEIVDDVARIGEGCNLCGACRDVCPVDAIIIDVTADTAPDDSYHGVWVFAERQDGEIRGVGYELLSKGRELADTLNTELCAVCFGHNLDGVEQLAACGADRVYLVDDPSLASQQEEVYAAELVRLIRERRPEIVLAGATSFGRAFFPRVAAVLKTGLTADCTGTLKKGSFYRRAPPLAATSWQPSSARQDDRRCPPSARVFSSVTRRTLPVREAAPPVREA